MQVAARRQDVGVELAVRGEPEHSQSLADRAAVARDGADAADCETMVATQQDREPARVEFRKNLRVHEPVPFDDLFEVAIAVDWRLPRVGRTVSVATIDDVESMRLKGRADLRYAQCFRAHAGTAITGADVGRRPDQRDIPIGNHDSRTPRGYSLTAPVIPET